MAGELRHRGSQLSDLSSNSAEVPLQNNDNINIVLLGKTGVGKSSSGNTILGKTDAFIYGRSLSPVTEVSECVTEMIEGRSVSVIDTPGFFCTTLSKDQLSEQFAKSVYNSAPGVHAFLFVVPYGRFTEQEEEILKRMQKAFGKHMLKHVIILFTYGDECIRKNIKSEINGNKFVKTVVQKCHDYHVLNNKGLNDRKQVTELLQKIDTMIKQNTYYTNEMYEYAHKYTFEHFWKIFKEYVVALIDFLCGKAKSLKMSLEECIHKNAYRPL